MQSSSLIFRKCSKYFKSFKLLPTTLEQKRKLWLWSIWFQIVNSVSCLSSKKNVTLLSYDYNTGFGTKMLDTSSCQFLRYSCQQKLTKRASAINKTWVCSFHVAYRIQLVIGSLSKKLINWMIYLTLVVRGQLDPV